MNGQMNEILKRNLVNKRKLKSWEKDVFCLLTFKEDLNSIGLGHLAM